jgi:hypothetical protein
MAPKFEAVRILKFNSWAIAAAAVALSLGATAPVDRVEPISARDFFNLGATQLGAGKFREAETHLETTLTRQDPRWQAPALYNLGHVRFALGQEELKKGPPGKPTALQGRQAAVSAMGASAQADQALASNQLDQLIAAYTRGRGARRELKAATDAVRRALKAHEATLLRWQRSAADFRGAGELAPAANPDPGYNARVVDEEIAKLIDSLKDLQQTAQMMQQAGEDLKQKMRQMKGKIPEPNMPPGAAGDEEEEEDQPQGPPPGAEESPSHEGEEMQLAPEQAAWMLETFKLDADRRLPMGQNEEAPPRERNRPTW